jgi:deoxyhypusine synthase
VDPEKLPNTVVVYLDSTVAMPVMTSYAMARRRPRKLKRLYDRREEMMRLLAGEYRKARQKRR